MRSIHFQQGRRSVATALGLLALAIYGATLEPEAFPGVSAQLLAGQAGLTPDPVFVAPLWGLLIRLLDALPVGGLALKAHWLSAVFAALSVALLTYAVSAIPHDRTREERRAAQAPGVGDWLSGAAAGWVLAFSAPFWFVATRAHAFPFHLFLWMSCSPLLIRYLRHSQIRPLCVYAAFYGLGCVESGLFVVMLPVVVTVLLIHLSAQRRFKPGRLVWPVLYFAAGCSALVLLALGYSWHPLLPGPDGGALVRLVRTIAEARFRAWWYGRSIETLALLLLVTWLPLLLTAFRRHTIDRSSRWGSYLLNAVLALVAVALLFDWPFSWWPGDPVNRLVLYVAAAVWIGYLAGYGYIVATSKRLVQPDRRRRTGRVALTLIAVLLLSAFVVNSGRIQHGAADAVHDWVGHAMDELEGKSVLFTGGVLDPLYRIAAHDRGAHLTVVNLHQINTPGNRWALAQAWGGGEPWPVTPEEMLDRLQADLAADDAVRASVAWAIRPDWLSSSAGAWTLQRTLFVAAGAEGAAAGGVTFLEVMEAELDRTESAVHRIRSWQRWWRQQVAETALQQGMRNELQGDRDGAVQAFELAVRIDPERIDARLHLLRLAQQAGQTGAAAAQRDGLLRFVRSHRTRLAAWAVPYTARQTPVATGAVARRLRLWDEADPAFGGRSVGDGWFDRAVHERPGVVTAIVEAAPGVHRLRPFWPAYQAAAAERPDDVRLVLTCARIAALLGEYESALRYLEYLEETGFHPPTWMFERGVLEALAGSLDEADRWFAAALNAGE